MGWGYVCDLKGMSVRVRVNVRASGWCGGGNEGGGGGLKASFSPVFRLINE